MLSDLLECYNRKLLIVSYDMLSVRPTTYVPETGGGFSFHNVSIVEMKKRKRK